MFTSYLGQKNLLKQRLATHAYYNTVNTNLHTRKFIFLTLKSAFLFPTALRWLNSNNFSALLHFTYDKLLLEKG